jgi:hypothetical protein
MELSGNILIYLGIGILTDILVTLYYLSINRLLAAQSAILCFLLTLTGYFVVESIVVDTNWLLIFVYSFGCAIGCFLTIKIDGKRNPSSKKKKKK